MKIRNFKYILGESLKSMIRNRLMSLASIVTVASCTLIFAISYSIIVNINQVLTGVERSLSIVVFIEDEATQEQVDELEGQIRGLDHVTGLRFISAEEAMDNLAFSLPEGILYGLGGSSILPRSFEIDIDSLYNQELVTAQLNQLNNIENIVQDQDMVDVFMTINRGVSVVGIIIILFLASISTVIIINTIKITVAARENEINIMKYVGATDGFIRWPFLMEGILIGIFGAVLAMIISYFIYFGVVNATTSGITAEFLEMMAFEVAEVGAVFMVLVPVSILMGVVIGTIGSVTSIRKYLRV